jgi:hypothetical protein
MFLSRVAVAVGIFAVLKWELGIVEAIIVIMSVGLSVDFVVHFGVGYIHANSTNIENERRKIRDRYRLTETITSNPSSVDNNGTTSQPRTSSSYVFSRLKSILIVII